MPNKEQQRPVPETLLGRTPNHWVQYEKGSLVIDPVNETVTFKVFSWGQDMIVTISFEAFHDNYYGNVKGKP